MNTRIIASSAESSHREYIDHWIRTLIAIIVGGLVWEGVYVSQRIQTLRDGTLFDHQAATFTAGAFTIGSIIFSYLAAELFNQRYRRKNVAFIKSISTRVEKEIGEKMTDRQVLSFLAAGKAADSTGNRLKVKHTKAEMQVLLTVAS